MLINESNFYDYEVDIRIAKKLNWLARGLRYVLMSQSSDTRCKKVCLSRCSSIATFDVSAINSNFAASGILGYS